MADIENIFLLVITAAVVIYTLYWLRMLEKQLDGLQDQIITLGDSVDLLLRRLWQDEYTAYRSAMRRAGEDAEPMYIWVNKKMAEMKEDKESEV